MPVPSVVWWQKKTTGTFADRKNPLITDIDILLTEYHAANKTDVQKQKILVLILFYCTTWLVSKGEKNGSWRRKYVQELETAIKDELRSPTMLNAIGQRVGGTAGVHMKEDPIELLQPRNLSDKFRLQADLNYTRMSAFHTGEFVSNFQQNTKLTGYAQALQQEMNSGSAHDYVDSLRIVAAGKAAGVKVSGNLTYLSKQERVKHQLSLWIDDCFHLADSYPPYQTAGDLNDIFAMDQMELIYVGDPRLGRFHHSTFMSGKPVLCAGEMKVRAGKITSVSNESGHYKPSTQDLLACVRVLERKYSANLTNMEVRDMAIDHTWNSATEFLARNGTPPRLGRRVARTQGSQSLV